MTKPKSSGTNSKQQTKPATTAVTTAADPEIRKEKSQYRDQVQQVKEMCPDWSDEDILEQLKENGYDTVAVIDAIFEGRAERWDMVSTKKKVVVKKEEPQRKPREDQKNSHTNTTSSTPANTQTQSSSQQQPLSHQSAPHHKHHHHHQSQHQQQPHQQQQQQQPQQSQEQQSQQLQQQGAANPVVVESAATLSTSVGSVSRGGAVPRGGRGGQVQSRGTGRSVARAPQPPTTSTSSSFVTPGTSWAAITSANVHTAPAPVAASTTSTSTTTATTATTTPVVAPVVSRSEPVMESTLENQWDAPVEAQTISPSPAHPVVAPPAGVVSSPVPIASEAWSTSHDTMGFAQQEAETSWSFNQFSGPSLTSQTTRSQAADPVVLPGSASQFALPISFGSLTLADEESRSPAADAFAAPQQQQQEQMQHMNGQSTQGPPGLMDAAFASHYMPMGGPAGFSSMPMFEPEMQQRMYYDAYQQSSNNNNAYPPQRVDKFSETPAGAGPQQYAMPPYPQYYGQQMYMPPGQYQYPNYSYPAYKQYSQHKPGPKPPQNAQYPKKYDRQQQGQYYNQGNFQPQPGQPGNAYSPQQPYWGN